MCAFRLIFPFILLEALPMTAIFWLVLMSLAQPLVASYHVGAVA